MQDLSGSPYFKVTATPFYFEVGLTDVAEYLPKQPPQTLFISPSGSVITNDLFCYAGYRHRLKPNSETYGSGDFKIGNHAD